jgi:hypothetical protein
MSELIATPTAHKEKMAEMQLSLFQSALQDVLKEASESFSESGTEIYNIRSLFTLTG